MWALRQAHESHAWKEDLAYRIWKVNQYTIPRKQKDATTIGHPVPPPADNVELVESSNISSDELGTPDGKPRKTHHDIDHDTVPVHASTSHHVRFSQT
ncbi:hypothetical protein SLS53_002424 [Cytospora paraplurivora]|uniref:Uncharacterized protein n=1 Tax=Cytospora paraplurivora TaxID=2898453 RepID=A0AAN9YL77_9PEZI